MPTPATPTTPATEGLRCSFCSKHQHDVDKIIAGPGVYICDECVGLCNEALAAGGPLRFLDDLTERSDDELTEIMTRIHRSYASVDETLQHVVRELRRRQVTWARIGAALGMTRQSAWERFSGEE